ncbi:MAG: Acetyl-coenzyme A carboxylase carboxyl transferase subunit beta, chloroplastic [Mycoplasmataceae bacterium]|nr:MAG: Acetyl-coenzyme A carboxylase carboxyl transferase subunit beta, chloroplastic [Mycoplasmataceae bacterium]
MNLSEYSAKFTIKDIETKSDRNFNPYYLIHFENNNYRFGYAFKNTLNSDNWTTAKKQIKWDKKWNKLTPKQQASKRKQWAEELKAEERELFAQFEKQQAKQSKKSQSQPVQEPKSPKDKVQCPDCGKFFKELNEEHWICSNCLRNYEN